MVYLLWNPRIICVEFELFWQVWVCWKTQIEEGGEAIPTLIHQTDTGGSESTLALLMFPSNFEVVSLNRFGKNCTFKYHSFLDDKIQFLGEEQLLGVIYLTFW